MLKIGIIPNEDKDEELKYTRILVDSIKKCGGTAIVCDDIALKLGDKESNINEDNIVDMSDVMVCLGGDGTFLKAARMTVVKASRFWVLILGSWVFWRMSTRTILKMR